MLSIRRSQTPFFFLLFAAGVYAAAFYVRGFLHTTHAPNVLAGAMVIDLVLLVPVAYYGFVVRRLAWPPPRATVPRTMG